MSVPMSCVLRLSAGRGGRVHHIHDAGRHQMTASGLKLSCLLHFARFLTGFVLIYCCRWLWQVYTASQKNEPILVENCSFVKHGLILIPLGKRHQHTFKNYTHSQLSLSLHLCLLYLLLNNCDGNDAKRDAFSSVDNVGGSEKSRCPSKEPVLF